MKEKRTVQSFTGFQISVSYMRHYIKKQWHSIDSTGSKNSKKYMFLEFNKQIEVKKTQ